MPLFPSKFRRSQVTPFVILFVERAGSTYLATALDSHPHVLAHRERFAQLRQQGKDDAQQLAWARDLWTPPLVGPYAALGFKTKIMDIPQPDNFARLVDEKRGKIIQLHRRNAVKGAISTINARQLHEASGNWNLLKESDRRPPQAIDPDDLRRQIELRENWDTELDDYVNFLRRPTLRLTYEELLQDENAFMSRVFEFLEVTPQPVEGKTLKNTSDNLREAITNFDALKASYTDTPYYAMFDEVISAPVSR